MSASASARPRRRRSTTTTRTWPLSDYYSAAAVVDDYDYVETCVGVGGARVATSRGRAAASIADCAWRRPSR